MSRNQKPLGVLTVKEAAQYLRVSERIVTELAKGDVLPGKQIGKDWRFLKEALDDWLRCRSDRRTRVMRHAGALADNEHEGEFLASIYRERGRPMTEAGDEP